MMGITSARVELSDVALALYELEKDKQRLQLVVQDATKQIKSLQTAIDVLKQMAQVV